ncbi:hypothetical protein K6L59_02220, partial [Candidatus Phytoplasma sp. Tabriz.2]|nr:hypothetical protein [Candidatus Phytoplasma australiense]
DQIDYFGTFFTLHDKKDSQFQDLIIQDPSNHTIKLNYKGPKWLIEEDKDFYMEEAQCDEFESIENLDGHFRYKKYYLHFNPVKQYLTLYTKKFNTKNDEESPKPRTRV